MILDAKTPTSNVQSGPSLENALRTQDSCIPAAGNRASYVVTIKHQLWCKTRSLSIGGGGDNLVKLLWDIVKLYNCNLQHF